MGTAGSEAGLGKLWLDPVSANAAIGKVLPEDRMIEKPSPLALAKAVKVCTFLFLQDAALRFLTVWSPISNTLEVVVFPVCSW
jgi:hypothetical protein